MWRSLTLLPGTLDAPQGLVPRGLVLAAAVCLLPALFTPLWKMTMFAPQYPDGLELSIYSHKLDSGRGGQDAKEINLLNHYIGMREIATEDFDEFKWMPFMIGGLVILFLRAAVLGRLGHLIDLVALFGYFSLYGMGSFAYKLYAYGHHLDPSAAVKVGPFTPPFFGYKQLANFEVYSYPGPATYALAAAGACLVAALFVAWRRRDVAAVPSQ
ncbi:MAG: hypothetical protein HY903_21270 [Deltaproteobacteria bacterium]|nr:hypothetical protein [Deltaproteobacteria bacterium]